MLPGLSTPKRRVEAPGGTVFFNNFSNTMFAQTERGRVPLALNLGSCNWTVSDADELAFLTREEDGSDALVIVDPARDVRRRQRLGTICVSDLLLTRDRFAAAIPGLLVTGGRGADGLPCWTRMLSVDRGAGYRLRLEEDGRLSYTRNGSCRRYFYDLRSRAATSAFEPERLWATLFENAFSPALVPPLPAGELSLSAVGECLRRTAAETGIRPAGLRLLALLSLMEREGAGLSELLERIELDWQLQYESLSREEFPSLALLQRQLSAASPEALRPGRLMQQKLVRWCRRFEAPAEARKNARLIRASAGAYGGLPEE